ncbi:MAG: 2-C-methyl-D-erythritol 2,4-cyclodiphosphate synthase [Acidaminobacter sp.]|uniref:2-C-methyl-D-erythritol 2,4-cyclodiphosphate synthase n=1 Tax=Acidaminobacter sp. TaxID=1872102 RepID=UPI00137EFFAE|nr:2-C-methyl-D-erythritol 2,4-cyclodiphosphate synthase [Acidaminobacter sp.]MZQ96554.1 2-C-methyl-D-erythritol 2,4-cyclodiphosphate synthase [Acidaminobacter sp.]
MKTGIGYDVHQLVPGRKLILGGVEIPHEVGLLGHSDADVLTHAIMDALLGAAGLGDIGRHFPDTDPAYRGISSLKLLEHVMVLIREKGYTVGNVDAVIAAQRPKLLPFMAQMKSALGPILGLKDEDLNLKATTTERLGFEGREEGISVTAVCLLEKSRERAL